MKISNQELSNTAHDILVDILKRKPTDSEVFWSVKSLPINIMDIGHEWGYSDTVFRDEVFVYLKEVLEENK